VFPLVEQALDVSPLRFAERHSHDESPRFGWIVVRNRRLEPLALRRRLA
jgi:hypothetical protein